jgi:hypothetical protein
MKITPRDIARALVDSMASATADPVQACDSAIVLLHRTNPGFTGRAFSKLVAREIRRRGDSAAGLLIVPNDRSLSAEHLRPLLEKKAGRTVALDRTTDPDLIGGAVLHIDHRRIDCSIQGALHALLKTCLQPLD